MSKLNEKLEAFEIKYKELMDEFSLHSEIMTNLSEGVNLVRADDQTIVYTNPKFETMFGYNLGELIGQHVSILNAPSLKNGLEVFNEINERLEREKEWQGEIKNIRKDKSEFWCYASIKSYYHHKYGQTYISVHRDITKRKEAEEKLKKTKIKLDGILKSISDQIIMIDQEFNIIYANDIVKEIYGTYVKGNKCHKVFHNLDNVCNNCLVLETFKDGEIHNHECIKAGMSGKNSYHWCQSNVVARDEIGKPLLVVEVSRDITERKRIVDELKKSEQKYHHLIDNLETSVMIIDKNEIFRVVNKKAAEGMGGKPSDFIGKSLFDIFSKDVADKYAKLHQDIIKTGEGDIFEHILQLPIGRRIFLTNEQPLMNENGEITAVQIIGMDITNHKKLEDKLRKSEAKYRKMLEDTIVGVWIIDSDLKTTFVNKPMSKMLGYERNEMIGRSLFDFMDIAGKKIAKHELNQKIEKGNSVDMEFSFIKKDGNYIYTQSRATPIINELGEFEGSFAFIIDITDQKSAKAKIEEQKKFLTDLLESLSHPFYVINIDDYSIEIANKVSGIEGIGKCYELTHNINKPCEDLHQCPIESVKKTKEPVFFEHFHYDDKGNPKCVEIHGYPILNEDGEVTKMIECNIDITERKLAEKQLKESDKMMRAILNAYPESMLILDKNSNVLEINEIAAQRLNKRIDEIKGNRIYDFAPHEVSKHRESLFREVLRTGKPIRNLDKMFGKYYDAIIYPILDDQNNVDKIAIFSQDITSNKKAEEKLLQSEERFRKLFETILEGVVVIDSNGKIVQTNPAAKRLLGFRYSEVEHSHYIDPRYDFIHPNGSTMTIEELAALLVMKKNIYVENVLIGVKNPNNKISWLNVNAAPLMNDNNEFFGIVCTFFNITERKKAEEEILKLNKLKSELLIRASHELKTPLTSIYNASSLLLELYKDELNSKSKKLVEIINKGGKRLESLIINLLDTSRIESGKLELKKKKENISDIIKQCVNECIYLAEYRELNIKLEIPRVLYVNIDRIRIEQVIINLLSNALKYTPPDGIITLSLESHKDYIDIRVKDTGIGLTLNEQQKIFKKFGKVERYGEGLDIDTEGTGLGLFISKNIVEAHNGSIWVESEGRNKGCLFVVRLPLV